MKVSPINDTGRLYRLEFLFSVFTILTLLIGASPLLAQEPESDPATEVDPDPAATAEPDSVNELDPQPEVEVEPEPLRLVESLRVSNGSSLVLTVPGPTTRVALADEEVALVRVISERELLVTGTKLAQTTIHVWLESGERLLYPLDIGRNLTLLKDALVDIHESITVAESVDGRTLVLKGSVETAADADEAEDRAREFFGARSGATGGDGVAIVNLIKYATGTPSFERDLAEALEEIDPRIRLRRIRVERAPFDPRDPQSTATAVAADAETYRDSFILSGRVKNIRKLTQALELADRYLGGSGGAVFAPQHVPIQGRNQLGGVGGLQGNNFNLGGIGVAGGGGAGGAGNASGFGTGVGGGLQGSGVGFDSNNPPAGLANFVSRGLNLTTAGGRVVSFLEVDDLDQILVSIRVLEIDRKRARSLGVNYVVNSSDFAIGSFTSPTGRFGVSDIAGGLLGDTAFGGAGALGTGANLVGSYVGDSTGVAAAIDFLEREGIGRSVAEPNVLTLTGEQSTIEVGGQVPIPTTAATNAAAFQGYFFQEFGVRLDIRPTVDANGIITLEASPTIIEPDEGINVEGVPGFSTQSVSTTARVRGDQSLVIGGLINYDDGVAERKVPLLGDIPLINPLFKWNQKRREEYELLFVITPHIRENLGVNGEQREFDLPDLDSRQNMPLKGESYPTQLTPEGIPVNWLKMDEPLPPGARGTVLPSWDRPLPTDGSKIPIPESKNSAVIEAGAAPSELEIEEVEEKGLLRSLFKRGDREAGESETAELGAAPYERVYEFSPPRAYVAEPKLVEPPKEPRRPLLKRLFRSPKSPTKERVSNDIRGVDGALFDHGERLQAPPLLPPAPPAPPKKRQSRGHFGRKTR